MTSLNLLPCGRLEGGRIAQAMFGRSTAALLSFAASLLLAWYRWPERKCPVLGMGVIFNILPGWRGNTCKR